MAASSLEGMSTSELVAWYTDRAVPQRYNAGIVAASIAVSVLGSYTTLLLLGRRTAKAGFRNVLLLVAAAGTMASVGIWGMHFIGMHMRLEPAPGLYWYIRFNPGWTVFSLFVPLLALACTFVFLGSQALFSWIRVIFSGILSGFIVALMHFTASFNANFRVTYGVIQTVFSVVLACCAATAALIVFFRWRSQWQDNWWKRLLCAAILATGVSSMHYLAVSGTRYYARPDIKADLTAGKTSNTVLSIAISAMCGVLCLISVIFVVSDMKNTRNTRSKSRQILVACAVFDRRGSLLVKPDGSLPLQVVHVEDMPKDILSQLDNREPLFQWFYSLSWDWTVLDAFADRIAARAFGLLSGPAKIIKGHTAETNTCTTADKIDRRQSQQPQTLYGLAQAQNKQARKAAGLGAFKDRLLECTFLLAHELGLPYDSVGVLFDKAIRTGTHLSDAASITGKTSKTGKDDSAAERADAVEDNASVYSLPYTKPTQEGAMLLLVREISQVGDDTVEAYHNRGFRFSETRFLASLFANKLGMDRNEMSGLLNEMKVYAKRGQKPVVQPNGVYAGLFAVRPTESSGTAITHEMTSNGDILVYGFARHQTPAYRLPDITDISPRAKHWLAGLIGSSMDVVRETAFAEALRHNNYIQSLNLPPFFSFEDSIYAQDTRMAEKMELAAFQTSLYIAIDAMCAALSTLTDLASTSYLSADILDAPSSADDTTEPARMLIFQTVLPSLSRRPTFQEYGSNWLTTSTFVLSPFSLFQRAQSALLKGRAHKDFVRSTKIELQKRYPPLPAGTSGLNDMMPSPSQEKRRKRVSGLSSPFSEKALSFGRKWDRRPSGKKEGVLRIDVESTSAAEQSDEVPLEILQSPVNLREISPNRSESSEVTLPEQLDHHHPVHEDGESRNRQRPISTVTAASSEAVPENDRFTPPPAFPASAAGQRSRNTTNTTAVDFSDEDILYVSPAGSLPAYASPDSARNGTAGALARGASLGRRVGQPGDRITAVRPLATAARLRSDGWYERALGELEHSESARDLFVTRQWSQTD